MLALGIGPNGIAAPARQPPPGTAPWRFPSASQTVSPAPGGDGDVRAGAPAWLAPSTPKMVAAWQDTTTGASRTTRSL